MLSTNLADIKKQQLFYLFALLPHWGRGDQALQRTTKSTGSFVQGPCISVNRKKRCPDNLATFEFSRNNCFASGNLATTRWQRIMNWRSMCQLYLVLDQKRAQEMPECPGALCPNSFFGVWLIFSRQLLYIWYCTARVRLRSIMKQSVACVARGRLNFFFFFFLNCDRWFSSSGRTRTLAVSQSLIMRECIIRISLPSLSDSPPSFTLSVFCPQLSPSHMINAHLSTQARHRGAAEGDWQSSDESWDHGADRMVSTVCCHCFHLWGNRGYLRKMQVWSTAHCLWSWI